MRRDAPEPDLGALLEAAGRIADSAVPPTRAVIAGLRIAGSETQLTQLIARVVNAEPHLARSFVGLVIAASPGAAAVALDALPPDLYCVAEEASQHGRFDLSFRSRTTAWRVIVEIKIHAGYGADQLERYLTSLADARPGEGYLVAITRDVPLHGDAPLSAARPAWLGSVRWGRLLRQLRELDIRDRDLRQQWLVALDVLEEEGAMGFTRADPTLFIAWREMNRAAAHLRTLVDGYRESVRDGLNEVIGRTPTSGGAVFVRTSDGEVTLARGGGMVVSRLRIGSQQQPVVRFGIGASTRIYACVDLLGYPRPAGVGTADSSVRERVRKLTALPEFGHSPAHDFLRAAYHLDGDDRPRLLVDDLPGDLTEWSLDVLRRAHAAGAFDHVLTP